MRLPGPVLEAYKLGVGAWPQVVQRAIAANITDANEIGNMVFYLHHPDRIGYPLQPGETALIQEWKRHRDYANTRIAIAKRNSTSYSEESLSWNYLKFE
ncbi:MAG: hypothetical protein WBD22_01175 [Pyrinomonadaceae bacterium]